MSTSEDVAASSVLGVSVGASATAILAGGAADFEKIYDASESSAGT